MTRRLIPLPVLGALAAGAIVVAPSAPAATPPTNAEVIAQADQICAQSNPKNIRLLKRARGLIARGRERAGARTLIRAERFELKYYGRIAALPETADPVFNDLVGDFLRFQRGQARARIQVGKAILAGRPFGVVNRFDTRAVKLLIKAGRVSERIGFTQC